MVPYERIYLKTWDNSKLINRNAYHQPGVEAGKKAAGEVIALQSKIIIFLRDNSDLPHTIESISESIEANGQQEKVFLICEHLAEQGERRIKKTTSKLLDQVTFQWV